MNYQSITDTPPIPTKPGPSIRICSDCVARKYTNDPPGSARMLAACECCGEVKNCRDIEKGRLQKRAPKKREPKRAKVLVQLGVIKTQVTVK